MERFKKLYNYYLENGELHSLFPELKKEENSWEIDKKEFIILQEEIENVLNLDTEIEEDDLYE